MVALKRKSLAVLDAALMLRYNILGLLTSKVRCSSVFAGREAGMAPVLWALVDPLQIRKSKQVCRICTECLLLLQFLQFFC